MATRWFETRRPVAAERLAKDQRTPHWLLDVLLKTHRWDRPVVEAVARHPNADLPLLRECVHMVSHQSVRAALAERTEARTDPEIRNELKESRAPEILTLLLAEASAQEYPALLRRLAKTSPQAAYWVLTSSPLPPGTRLPRTDLLPLLRTGSGVSSPDAIALLGRLGDILVEEEPRPSRRRAATR